mgnify:CR=1 FL=1
MLEFLQCLAKRDKALGMVAPVAITTWVLCEVPDNIPQCRACAKGHAGREPGFNFQYGFRKSLHIGNFANLVKQVEVFTGWAFGVPAYRSIASGVHGNSAAKAVMPIAAAGQLQPGNVVVHMPVVKLGCEMQGRFFTDVGMRINFCAGCRSLRVVIKELGIALGKFHVGIALQYPRRAHPTNMYESQRQIAADFPRHPNAPLEA